MEFSSELNYLVFIDHSLHCCLENLWNSSYPSSGNSSSSLQSDQSGSSDHVVGIVIGSVIAAVLVFAVVSCFCICLHFICDDCNSVMEVEDILNWIELQLLQSQRGSFYSDSLLLIIKAVRPAVHE